MGGYWFLVYPCVHLVSHVAFGTRDQWSATIIISLEHTYNVPARDDDPQKLGRNEQMLVALACVATGYYPSLGDQAIRYDDRKASPILLKRPRYDNHNDH